MSAEPTASPTVVYVASLGHSGSTLLDLLISSHGQAFGLGEVKTLSFRPRRRTRRMRLDEVPCDCGASPRRSCAFWSALDQDLQRCAGLSLDALELHDGSDARFRPHNLAFYRSVARVSGRRLLVDSSKSLERLGRLLAIPELDLRPIQLVRDARGVVASHARRGRPWPATLRRWIVHQRATARLLAERPGLRVHYEALATEPAAVLTEIMSWLGLAFEPAQLDWTRHVHHHLAGNPMRRERRGEIRLDDAWRRELGLLPRTLIPPIARFGAGPHPPGMAAGQAGRRVTSQR